jgi:lipopolysaccharide export system protein LptC
MSGRYRYRIISVLIVAGIAFFIVLKNDENSFDFGNLADEQMAGDTIKNHEEIRNTGSSRSKNF